MEGHLLWEPSEADLVDANISHFTGWLRDTEELDFQDYNQLWNWSVNEISDFWRSIWNYFEIFLQKILQLQLPD